MEPENRRRSRRNQFHSAVCSTISKNEPRFLARVFDLISDDPRSSNSRVQTKKTLHTGAVYLAERLHFRGLFIRAPRNEKYRKERKGERGEEEKSRRTMEKKKARRTSGCTGGEVSRFFSPAFEIVLGVYTSRLTEKSSFRYLLKAIRHKTESTGPTSPVASRSVR